MYVSGVLITCHRIQLLIHLFIMCVCFLFSFLLCVNDKHFSMYRAHGNMSFTISARPGWDHVPCFGCHELFFVPFQRFALEISAGSRRCCVTSRGKPFSHQRSPGSALRLKASLRCWFCDVTAFTKS